MINAFVKSNYRWSTFGILLLLIIGGCAPAGVKDTATNEGLEYNGHTSKVHIVQNVNDELAGILSAEASIGQVQIGNSKAEIFQLLGSPDQRQTEDSGYESWNYNKHDLSVEFYKETRDMPAGNVVRIEIGSKSDLKTELGIGISSNTEQIEQAYTRLNGNTNLTSLWVNGANKETGKGYFPTLKFAVDRNLVSSIELSNKGINPGPIQEKPIRLSDLEIGDIRIGGSIDDVVKQYGQPSEKMTAHGLGSPYWIFKEQGFTVDFGGPVWRISVMDVKVGSTPRGIHVGSTKSEVRKAYPDASNGDSIVQKSTDGQYMMQFAIKDEKVSEIIISQDVELK